MFNHVNNTCSNCCSLFHIASFHLLFAARSNAYRRRSKRKRFHVVHPKLVFERWSPLWFVGVISSFLKHKTHNSTVFCRHRECRRSAENSSLIVLQCRCIFSHVWCVWCVGFCPWSGTRISDSGFLMRCSPLTCHLPPIKSAGKSAEGDHLQGKHNMLRQICEFI